MGLAASDGVGKRENWRTNAHPARPPEKKVLIPQPGAAEANMISLQICSCDISEKPAINFLANIR